MRRRTQRRAPAKVEMSTIGIDRMVRNIRTGHFERSLAALMAAGSLITAAEIYFEHDKASFGNRLMWLPVAMGPVGCAAGIAGFASRSLAKTALPIASLAIVANGIQGTRRPRKGTSTPGKREAIRRTSSVTASAAVSSASESVSPANDQSVGNRPWVNQVSCAKTVGTPISPPSRSCGPASR